MKQQTDTRPCEVCGGRGYKLCSVGIRTDAVHRAKCEACDGTGRVEITVTEADCICRKRPAGKLHPLAARKLYADQRACPVHGTKSATNLNTIDGRSPVLFLDVDGVLNHRDRFCRGLPGGVGRFDPECVAQLRRVLNVTGARIVVSSAWRKPGDDDGQHFNATVLGPAGLPRVAIGITEPAESIKENGVWRTVPRGNLIRRWLDRHPEIDRWAVVDDENDMDGVPPERFVQTSFHGGGLLVEHADRLIEILWEPTGKQKPPTRHPPEPATSSMRTT